MIKNPRFTRFQLKYYKEGVNATLEGSMQIEKVFRDWITNNDFSLLFGKNVENTVNGVPSLTEILFFSSIAKRRAAIRLLFPLRKEEDYFTDMPMYIRIELLHCILCILSSRKGNSMLL